MQARRDYGVKNRRAHPQTLHQLALSSHPTSLIQPQQLCCVYPDVVWGTAAEVIIHSNHEHRTSTAIGLSTHWKHLHLSRPRRYITVLLPCTLDIFLLSYLLTYSFACWLQRQKKCRRSLCLARNVKILTLRYDTIEEFNVKMLTLNNLLNPELLQEVC